LDAIQPKVIIVADSDFPATKRASTALRERLAQHNIPIFYTRTTGAVTIIINQRLETTNDGRRARSRIQTTMNNLRRVNRHAQSEQFFAGMIFLAGGS